MKEEEIILIPDRPFSLFEGIAGTICFYINLLNCKNFW
jgi:hypothetical protein